MLNKPSLSNTMILITVICMDLLTGMEFDLFVPSFPQLQTHFELTPFWTEALLSINFAGYCLSLFFVGLLADRYGRKPIILFGLIIFAIGSMLCLFTASYSFIFIGRFLQGIGIAAPAILSFLIITDAYPLKEQQFLMAILNGSLNFAVAIAPVIGSYLTLYFDWRGNFAALFILGLIVLVMTVLFIPYYHLRARDEALSLRGYIPLFKSKTLMLLIVTLLFIFVPYWIFVGISPLLYIKDLGVSLAHFGYYQGVLAFVFALGSILFGLLIKHIDYDQKQMLVISLLLLMVSLFVVSFVTVANSASPMLITFTMLIFVIAQIIPSVILYPLCLNYMSQAKARVSALIQGSRLILTALSLQIAGYFYVGTFRKVGLIICIFILLGVWTLFLVVGNPTKMLSQSFNS